MYMLPLNTISLQSHSWICCGMHQELIHWSFCQQKVAINYFSFCISLYSVKVNTVYTRTVFVGNWNWKWSRKAGTLSLILHQIYQDWNQLQICSHRKSRWTKGRQDSLLEVTVLPQSKMALPCYSSVVSRRLKYSCFFLHQPTQMWIAYYWHWVTPIISSSRSLRVSFQS